MELITSVFLWSGSGYALDEFEVKDPTPSEEYALEQVVADIVNNDYTEYFEEEDSEWIEQENNQPWDDPDFDPEGWLYVDATMDGADRPVYIRIENLRFGFKEKEIPLMSL